MRPRGTDPPDWEQELNPEQLEAVTWGGGPLLVFAGAGSGKTRVITYRIIHLVRVRSARPAHILGLTFTNKAAGEMRERVRAHMPDGIQPPFLGTFHAFCARILRIHGSRASIPSEFSIYGEQDQIAVLRRVLADLNLDRSRFNPKTLRGWIDSVKRDGADPGADGKDVLAQIFGAYENHLARQGALDFNDLILKSIAMLRDHESIRDEIAGRYRRVLVDEFQDTNRMQMRLLELLAPPPDAPLTVVGDDDQSIYRWRGADVKNILEFGERYRAHVVKLERNYRSTSNILSAAHCVIDKNPTRAPKTLWTSRGPGEPIDLYMASSEEDEARFIARRAHRLRDEGTRLSRQAVLYRIHAQSRAIEESLRSEDLPYRIVGGTRFFGRAEIRDLVAYLRLARNPSDDVALLRVLNTPPRGLGQRTLEIVRNEAASARTSLLEAARSVASGSVSNKRASRSLARLCDMVESWHGSGSPPSAILERIIEETGFAEYLARAYGPESEARILNIRELVAWAHEFESGQAEAGLDALLERIALHTDLDELPEEADALVLMTVHSAKGLEFDSVTVTGLEDDLFPYQNTFTRENLTPEEQDEELYEERRLFYVAVTRARHSLALTCSRKRRLFGTSTRYRSPSIFLDNIPEDLLREQSWIQHRADIVQPEPVKATGERVLHRKFGPGRVLRVEEGVRRKLVIRFDDGRTRKILEEFIEPERP